MKNRYLLLLGILTGGLSSYLGIGGGVVLVPVLTVFFKYPIKSALGTSLATLPLSAMAGLVIHLFIQQKSLNFIPVSIIAAGAVFGARAGVFLSERIKSKYIKVIFTIFLLYAGVKQLGFVSMSLDHKTIFSNWSFFICLGLTAGLSSSLLGIGGGIVLVPVLNMVFGFSMHEAIIMSLAVIVPTSLAGTFFYSKNKNIEFTALKYLVPGALIGAIAGAMFSSVSSVGVIHKVLGGLLIILSGKMFFLSCQTFKTNGPEIADN